MNNTQDEDEDEPIMQSNMFTKTLGEISHGDLVDQASELLQELAIAVRETGKKGTLTLVVEIKPRGRDCGQVEINGSLSKKSPIADIAPSMLWVSEDGQLLRDNPAQLKMNFKDMPKAVRKQQAQ